MDTIFGKRQYMELESQEVSSTCFSNGCGRSSVQFDSLSCNPGAYVYQITGYSGSNLGSYDVYATKFDLFCSDGESLSVGDIGKFLHSIDTIANPLGYQAVTVGGGCISDHIQIGGFDFGNSGFGGLHSCSCSPGLNFVGFPKLQYLSYWPSFATISILCDSYCPKGEYYSNGNCFRCAQGTTSSPGSIGSNSCFSIITNVGDGSDFVLQVEGLNTFVSAILGNPVVTESKYDPTNPNLILNYNATTQQIIVPANDLCLDDGGNEANGLTNVYSILTFSSCDSSNINQQFVFTPGGQILNPNWPMQQMCLRGDGGGAFAGYQKLILWECNAQKYHETFIASPICPAGK